jgi:pantoate--beta-alanine ligase
VRPDVAVFGRKDFQQVVLIRRMVRDLDLGVRIETGPLVRDENGLALSSRNRTVSAEDRAQAFGLARALESTDELFRQGETGPAALVGRFAEVVGRYPGLSVQYVEHVDPE